MFRVNKPLTSLSRFASSKLCQSNAMMMSPALVLTSMRTAAGGTKGAPPISIDDLYGLCFLAEPTVRPPVEREPRDMFECDTRINEVVAYINGGLHATNDKVSEDFVMHMFEASWVDDIYSAKSHGLSPCECAVSVHGATFGHEHGYGSWNVIGFDALHCSDVIFFPRDASNKPQEFRDILKSEGGSEELPQLWVQGKCVGSGSELKDFDRVWELCTPARVAYPRTGPKGAYRQGFYNAPGVTQSDKVWRSALSLSDSIGLLHCNGGCFRLSEPAKYENSNVVTHDRDSVLFFAGSVRAKLYLWIHPHFVRRFISLWQRCSDTVNVVIAIPSCTHLLYQQIQRLKSILVSINTFSVISIDFWQSVDGFHFCSNILIDRLWTLEWLHDSSWN